MASGCGGESVRPVELSEPIQEAPPAREPTAMETRAKERRARNRAFSDNLGTSAAFARDESFLYFAVTCPNVAAERSAVADSPNRASLNDALADAAGESTKPNEAPRERDPILDAQDRVEIQIDLDGDYATTFKFVFDRRGRVYDAVWDDASWNPEIYVANSETNANWTLEVALPLAELTSRAPESGEAWRVAIRRVDPGVGVECWNVENSDAGEGAFGLLVFE